MHQFKTIHVLLTFQPTFGSVSYTKILWNWNGTHVRKYYYVFAWTV